MSTDRTDRSTPTARPDVIFSGARGSTLAGLFAAALAGLAAAVLAGRVLQSLAQGDSTATLERALPGVASALVLRWAATPLVPCALIALLPLAVWASCSALARRPGVPVRGASFALPLIWLVSASVSATALMTGMTGTKTGMAALGYALAWPAVMSLSAALALRDVPVRRFVTVISLAVLAGLVARLLPVGWPRDHSLSWWPMLPAVPAARLITGLSLVATAWLALVLMRSPRLSIPMPARLVLPTLAVALLLRGLPLFEHYGPDKHIAALASENNTSYFQVATEIVNPGDFARGHFETMASRPMHARTHPPGWPLLFHAAIEAGDTPGAARIASFTRAMLGCDEAGSAQLASSVAERPLTAREVTGLWLVLAALTLCVIALPAAVYFAARAFAPPGVALLAAGWAALLPAALLYFPSVDVAHPTLYAIAAGCWWRAGRHTFWALLAGAVAAGLVWLSFGNLAIYLLLVLTGVLGWRSGNRRSVGELARVLALLAPVVTLTVLGELSGWRPVAIFSEAMRQHHLILAGRSRVLWTLLSPLEVAVGLGIPSVVWLLRVVDFRVLVASARRLVLTGGPVVLASTVATLLVLDLSGQSKGETARLWMGMFSLALVGASPALADRPGEWPRLAALLAAALVVLKGFYVFVWPYTLH